MRRLSLLSLLFLSCATPAPVDLDARARELAYRFILVDTHIDVPYRLHDQQTAGSTMEDVGDSAPNGDFDYRRAIAGGLDAPFMSIFTPAEDEASKTSKKVAESLIDLVEGIRDAHPDRFTIARSAEEVRSAAAGGKIALLLGMENGSPIEGDLANLEHFFQRGVRYITLCHGQDNHICDSSYDTRHTHKGLTPFGRDVVRRMNELGVMVDISHVSDDTFWQVIEMARAPVIASHSSLRHFTPGFERNMSDEMVQALKKNGGVVQINFGSSFLTAKANGFELTRRQAAAAFQAQHAVGPESPELAAFMKGWNAEHPFPYADVKDVADHIERVIQLAGIDHVGLGSDFDGVGDSLPTGLKNVSMYPNLIAELLRRGHSSRDIEKICGGNLLRVLAECEALAQGG